MSNYWKKKLDELEQNTATKNTTQSSKDSTQSYWNKKMAELDELEARKKKLSEVNAPIRKAVATTKKKDEEERKWFNSGLFKDGYDFGDITKTILGSGTDATENLSSSIMGMGEKALDSLLMLGSAMNAQQMNQAAQNEMMFNAVTGKETKGVLENYQKAQKQVEKETAEYVKKDLYNEEEIAKKIITKPVEKATGINVEDTSVFGEKSDSLIQSFGQMLGTAGLQAIGVPWFVTTGATSFGSQSEQALNEGATFQEANASALISAGAEILTEKLFGGSGLGEKGLINLEPITKGISSKVVKALADYGVDMFAEGTEEIVSQVASNLGSALHKEDNLKDILWSEEAVDGYIESFIGGAVIGGGMNIGKIAKSVKNKTDYRTGLTAQEEQVVDKETENRIAELEKDGETLTKEEKSKIREEVISDLDRGYISADTIESALGGETYDNYKSVTEQEEALQKEFDTLNKMRQLDMTGEQIDRRSELKQQLEELKSNSQRDTLKKQLGDEVSNLVKGSRLSETYNEQTRRSQYFEADLTKYDEKQQTIVQKAIDSKLLNNTNRTHDFVDMIAKLSAEKGVLFDFTNNEKLKESGFAVGEGKVANGFVNNDGDIVINMDSHKAYRSVVGHEITHILEGTELYTELQEMVKQYATTKGEYVDRMQSLRDLYTGVYEGKDFDEKIRRELTADIVGDYLFTDEKFINSLSTEKPNLFKRIYNEIKYLYKVATAGSKEARELERVKRAFDKAYKQSGKAQGETKLSMSEEGNYGYHAGDLGKAEGYWNMTSSNRGTGHFGTGTYFVGDEAQINDDTYGNRPHEKVDFSKYKLYKPLIESYGFELHSNLKYINDNISLYPIASMNFEEMYDVCKEIEDAEFTRSNENATESEKAEAQRILDEAKERFEEIGYDPDYMYSDELKEKLSDLRNDYQSATFELNTLFGFNAEEKIKSALKGVYDEVSQIEDSYNARYEDSPSTRFMKAMGYEGIDVRGFKGLDNTAYGSVIYDLKGEDLARKKEIGTARYSLSDSDGKQLTKEQQDYFKDSKVRDENGNLKVMYHGSQDAGFHTFDSSMSDDDTSFFFVDRNDVAATYSGTSETYEAKTIRTTEDMNNFLAEIGYDDYKAVEKNGKFELLENNEHVAYSDTAQGLYEEFCWYEGVGDGDANYKVYLNLTNPLEVDAEGRNWNNVSREFSQEVADRYNSLTAEEKAALVNLAEWGEYSIFRDEMLEARANEQGGGVFDEEYTKHLARAYEKLGGANANLYDAFSIASDNFSAESIQKFAVKQMNTRDYAKKAKDQGYDGVIFKNIHDNGGYSNGSEGASTVAIAFESNQIKSVANANPTKNADIRYSLSKDSEGRKLSKEQQDYFRNAKTVDEEGRLKPFYHGTGRADRVGTIFDPNRATSGPMAYFTDSKEIADNYARDKNDTSIAYDSEYDSYETQFRVERNGKNMSVVDLWYKLPLSERNAIYEKAKHITMDDNWENVIYSEETQYGLGNFDKYELNRHKGNVLHTLVDSWLTDGNIYGEEHKFLDVLKLVGIEDAKYMNPDFRDEKTYQVYLNITNPFDTSDISEEMLEALRTAAKNAEYVEGNSADLWDKRNISPDQWIKGLEEDIADGTFYTWTRIPDFVTDTLKAHGYDGIFDIGGKGGGIGHTVAIPFYSEQIKNVDNLNPTENPDIRYSLSKENDIAPIKSGNVPLKDLAYQSTVSKTEQVQKDILPIKEGVAKNTTTIPEGFAPMTEAEFNELNDDSDRLNSLTDNDMPPLKEAPYYEDNDVIHLPQKRVDDIAKTVYDYVFPKHGEKKVLKDVIQRYATSEIPDRYALFDEIKKVYGERTYTEEDVDLLEVQNVLRAYPLQITDDIKAEYPEYADFMRKHKGRLLFANKGAKVDDAYQELSNLYPGYFPDTIWNSADQFARMVEVSEMDRFATDTWELLDEDIQKATDIIADEVAKYTETQLQKLSEQTNRAFYRMSPKYWEALMPPIAEGVSENTAPIKAVKTEKQNKGNMQDEKIAQILMNEPKVDKKKGFKRDVERFMSNFVDRAAPIETLALEKGNRELDGKFNSIRYADTKAQTVIGEGVKEKGVKSLNEIFGQFGSEADLEKFYNYLYHKHNVDRMSLESRELPNLERLTEEMHQLKFDNLEEKQLYAIAKESTDNTTEKRAHIIETVREYLKSLGVENKAVYGDSVTAEISQEIVEKYEFNNPDFIKIAEDVYNFNRHLRSEMVDGGLISQETADLFEELYPHYVPIRRVNHNGSGVNVPLDTRKTGVNTPIKRAQGGNSDILPLAQTMAQRTLQTYKAIAKNRFGVELKNTLGTTIESTETDVDEIVESVDTHEELLKEGKNGANPTFTVFENGEKVTFEITEAIYDALKPTSEALSKTYNVLSKPTGLFKKLVTEYNPAFMLTNPIKDTQDVLINSQHPLKTYKNYPKAIAGLLSKKGRWYNEYMSNGGKDDSYFDRETNTFTEEKSGVKKVVGFPFEKISEANNFLERLPRLAEYIASREMGRSIDVAMLDSARVTTNFRAGGDITKFLNRNGVTFLNPSVQGAVQQVRNVREAKANGLKGWALLATKVALAGLPGMLLNGLLWDDDEDYEELSDYVKQNYYIVWKNEDGKFIRIPKGRALAVIQNAFTQVQNAVTGNDEVDISSFLELVANNLAPNNPLENNILAPIMQVKNNKTWYGEDLVPSRLADLPAKEQFDESTDKFSKWLGDKLDISPVKINYLLNQYSGGVGDMILPMLTPEAESGKNSVLSNFTAPIRDKFTTDSVMNNQNVSNFYELSDELKVNANSIEATEEDILKNKYFNAIRTEMSALYKEKREIQNNEYLNDSEKYNRVREVQEEINALSEEALNSYNSVAVEGKYAEIGDKQYRMNNDNEWQKISDEEIEKQNEVIGILGITKSQYWNNKKEYDMKAFYPEKYKVLQEQGISVEDYKENYEEMAHIYTDDYSWASNNPEKYTLSKAVTDDVSQYKQYTSDLYNIKADKDSNGKSISGSRKEKVHDYIFDLDIEDGAKYILFKSEYNADDTYNYEIINYLNEREDISYTDMETILKELGFEVDSQGNISW